VKLKVSHRLFWAKDSVVAIIMKRLRKITGKDDLAVKMMTQENKNKNERVAINEKNS